MGNTAQVIDPPLVNSTSQETGPSTPNAPSICINTNIAHPKEPSTHGNAQETQSQIISKYIQISINWPASTLKTPSETPIIDATSKGIENAPETNIARTAPSEGSSDETEGEAIKNKSRSDQKFITDTSIETAFDCPDVPWATKPGSWRKDIRDVYKMQNPIGEGHFGKVRWAYLRPGKEAAKPTAHKYFGIKSISKKHLNIKEIEELKKEVEILSSLDHPNIIKFYETYHDQYFFHIVMELCRGKDLLTKFKEKKVVDEKKVALIIVKLLHAISYCHLRGITHRDLKPENILFETEDSDSEIKWIDFGLSKKYSQEEKMHTILGTPFYIAPEVLKGSYDEKCDIWSIGAITYLLLCGEPPYYGEDNNKIFTKILHDDVRFERRKWQNISGEAQSFVRMCLNKAPELRPSAMNALKHEWFNSLLSRVHSSWYISREIWTNLQHYAPSTKLKKIVSKYFINNLSASEIKIYKSAFYAIDFNHTGAINANELRKAFELGGVAVSNEDIKRILSAAEDPTKGRLDYSEFIIACFNFRRAITKDQVEQAFKYFDMDGSGWIDAKDIKNALLRFGKRWTKKDDPEKLIQEVTKNTETDTLNFDQFFRMFTAPDANAQTTALTQTSLTTLAQYNQALQQRKASLIK